jgi:hypothetical protein
MRLHSVVEMNRHVCVFAVMAVILPSAWCGRHETTVEFYFADGHHFSKAERDAIQAVADATAVEVRHYLPTLPRDVVLKVQAGKKVLPETGETGYSTPPNTVYWTMDPDRKGGVTAITQTQLRGSLFEFFHHLVRDQTIKSTSLMDQVVTDGMAIVFERDFAGASPPWGVYPDKVTDWVNELMALPPTTDWDHFKSDPRRWIRFKTGTYLVDRAMHSSGQSSAQLVSRSTEDVIRMALGR